MKFSFLVIALLQTAAYSAPYDVAVKVSYTGMTMCPPRATVF